MPIKTPKKQDLTQAEKEVLKLITEDFLTPKQIIIRRQCSRQAVYKILKSLKNKGALGLTGQSVDKVDKIEGLVNQSLVRLHGQEFNIKILYQDHHYQKSVEKSNILFIDGHTIKLYKNTIELYSGTGTSFYGDTAQEAFSKSLAYWRAFLAKLEHDLRVILVKPRSRNMRIVNQHFARGNSEVYHNALENHDKIRIYTRDDGKLWFMCDDSFSMSEDETVHSKTSKPDREEVDKHLNDWRDHKPPTNSQLAAHIAQTSQNLENYAVHLKAHVESVQKLGAAVEELTSIVKELKK